ncbi:MAG TPA: ComF family protein [Acidobacteria bacterium]|nr:ComF family protein [Acidobacteriota bacterium]
MNRDLLSRMLASLFPGCCLLCGEELPARARFSACPACWAGLPLLEPAAASDSHPPPDPLSALVAPYRYEGGTVKLHRRMKFAGALELTIPCAGRMAAAWQVRGPWRPDLLLPVPPDPLRWGPRRRVSRALARILGQRLGVAVAPRAARKIRHTRPLSTLGARQRRGRLAGAFAARAELVEGRRILLIDDVSTTGSTLAALAEVLHRSGAGAVAACVLARTPRRIAAAAHGGSPARAADSG